MFKKKFDTSKKVPEELLKVLQPQEELEKNSTTARTAFKKFYKHKKSFLKKFTTRRSAFKKF